MGDLLDRIEPPAVSPGEAMPKTIYTDDFDWFTDDSVVIGSQPATAVYRNKLNAVVIRQEGNGVDDDPCVLLRDDEAVRVLIAALRREIGAGRRG